MAAATPTLPLHCNICPKKPNFSDVSHLLTHVASKGHLAHYYKVKVRSSQDPVAKCIIDEYDQWYGQYNVEQLMSERMYQKDRKRPRARAQAAVPNAPIMPKSSTVDPLLSVLNAHETSFGPYDSLPSFPAISPWADLLPAASSEPFKPPMALWRTCRPRTAVSMVSSISGSSPERLLSRLRPGSGMAPEAPMMSNNTNMLVAFDNEDDGVSEAAKLKGVFWPGMDIFDAATPEMKKKRNQKKDTSVAVQLEKHSLYVEPTEMIFTPLGSLRKQRTISGQAEFDSSPDRLSLPTPKPKRRQVGRQPLSKKDVNTSAAPTQTTPTIPPFPGYGPVVNNKSDSTKGPDQGKKRKRTFEVFEDNDHPALDHSATMRLLTSGFRPASQAGSDTRLVPSTLVDINTGALYHNNVFAEAFEPFHSSFYSLPYHGQSYHGHPGIGISGLIPTVHTNLSYQAEVPEKNAPKIEDCEDSCTVSAHSDD